ncbi:Hypothetical protein PBC10988_31410 [Planctomycetales bacterium 10988]|nr:Hypothetical protein PBC10988_31410 [Planctomycetales bacterium 10988]
MTSSQEWFLFWAVWGPLPILVFLYIFVAILPAYIIGRRGGVPISVWRIISMRSRYVNATDVIRTRIVADNHQIEATWEEIETAYLEGIELEDIRERMAQEPPLPEPAEGETIDENAPPERVFADYLPKGSKKKKKAKT